MGTLYIVATPIGNRQDITLRALEILNQVDVIACEDTRHTNNLLNFYKIDKRVIATHAHNERNSAMGIVKLLEEGKDVAYVSDAGTPAVSDPGAHLVEIVRQHDFKIVPIGGISALTTIISVAGLIGKSFTFEGFLPVKGKKRVDRLEKLLNRNEAFVLYESPFRVIKLLEELTLLEATRKIIIGRELSKIYEQIISGTASELLQQFKQRDSIKGEFVICVGVRVPK